MEVVHRYAVLFALAVRSRPDGNLSMNRQFRIVGIVILPILVLGVIILELYSGEVTSISYDTYEDAKSAEAFGAYKWLPSLIPTTARNIQESHDVDSNEVWFMFSFEKNFEPPFETCSSTDRNSVVMRKPKGWDRFPKFVRDARSQVIQPGKALFACQGESYQYFLSIDRKAGLAIGWSVVD